MSTADGAVRHVPCPECGGPLDMLPGGAQVRRCAYCDARLFVDAPTIVPEYAVDPQIDAQAARRELQRFLRSDDVPAHLLRASRFAGAQLVFVPYHEVWAVRIGRLSHLVRTTIEPGRRSWAAVGPEGGFVSALPVEHPAKTREHRETNVLWHTVARWEPAVDPEPWGLAHTGFADLVHRRSQVPLRPFDKARDGERGILVLPSRSIDRLLDQLRIPSLTQQVDDDTEYADVCRRRVYYPLWRLRYQVAGRGFEAVVDAVTGGLVRGRAPARDEPRCAALAAACVLAGVLVGGALRAGAQGGVGAVLGVLAAALVGAGAVTAVAWSRFRYRAQVEVTPEGAMVRYYDVLFRRMVRAPVRRWWGKGRSR